MPSQIELLEESIADLEHESGPENPLLKGLRLKVAGLHSQQEKDRLNQAVKELLGKPWTR